MPQITVCTTASSTDGLSRTCELRDALGTTATSDDATMRSVLLRATEWAESVVDRPLRAQTYSEAVPAYGTRRLTLSRRPVVCVLRLLSSTATSDATELTSTEYRVEDAEAGFLSREVGFEWTNDPARGETRFSLGLTPATLPGQEQRPWLVEYVAGYIFPEMATSDSIYATQATSTGRTLPYDLEQAVLLKAARWYQGGPMGADVTSRRVGDLSVTYAEPGAREEERLLARYRAAF
ncbi:MAG TPA: hypothetical protein DCP69_11295 [Candidatus Omnitrophica bacterium]|nr:hypothetical protein [Candidatus Omnitrophota bacterium]